MRTATALLALPALGWAYPGIMGGSRDDMLEMLKTQREAERRQAPDPVDVIEDAAQDLGLGIVGNVKEKRDGLVGGLVGTLAGDIAGLTASLASSVNPDNLRPEPGYEFQEPGPGDARGPCPGLNLLANYGYLPRNGYITYEQGVAAVDRGFNMGADLATILLVFAILSDGDIEKEAFWIGTDPETHLGGLNRHSTVECDISPNREDFYTGCGDNHHLSSRLVTQMVDCAVTSQDKDIGEDTMGCHYKLTSHFTQKYNPFLYYFPFPSIVSLGAYVFYPNLMSNGTYKDGGVANYESIASIIGAQYEESTGTFKYVPERWPSSGWYRRSYAYGAVQTLADIAAYILPENPVAEPIGQFGTPNFNITNILCDVVQGIQSITPLTLASDTETIEAGLSWAVGKLGIAGLSNEILGCPTTTLSPNFPIYANSTNEGGPLNPPPSVAQWVGNNVYHKTYFTSAPTTPQCHHSS